MLDCPPINCRCMGVAYLRAYVSRCFASPEDQPIAGKTEKSAI